MQPRPRQVALGLHDRTVLFILVAIFVGGALLLLTPQVPASESEAATADVKPYTDDPRSANGTVVDATIAAEPPGEAVSNRGISTVFTKEVQHWAPKILQWSGEFGLDPDIIATIMQIESCGDPGAASYAGAQGLFQVMPFHFEPGEDMLDPDTNARRGMAFFNRQLDYTGQDIYLSFAGYNGGYAASGSTYPYWANETQRYFNWAKGIFDEAKAGMVESPTLQQWLAAGGSGGCQRASERLGL